MPAPLLSIGLPVYNGERYVRQALDSILSQDLTDFELIICDNASTDQTGRICQDYAARDSRIHYHRNPQNLGAIPNHNRAFHFACGRYFKWAGHDDECAPTMLSRCVATLESAPQSVVLVYTQAELIDEDGRVTERYSNSIECRDPRPHRRLARVVASVKLGTPAYGVVRTEVLRQTLLFGSFFGSDYVLLAELAILGQIWELPEALLRKRLHAERATQASFNEQAWAAWSNPSKRPSRFSLSRWDRVDREYVRAIGRSRLSPWEKLLCVLAVLRNSSTQRERWDRWRGRLGLPARRQTVPAG